MNDMPSSVTVGGHRIAVVIDPSAEDWGSYEFEPQRVIKLKPSTPEIMWATLRHEMMHSCFEISGMSYLTDCATMPEEAVIRCLDGLFWPAWDNVPKPPASVS